MFGSNLDWDTDYRDYAVPPVWEPAEGKPAICPPSEFKKSKLNEKRDTRQ
jgi:hypothetical protein